MLGRAHLGPLRELAIDDGLRGRKTRKRRCICFEILPKAIGYLTHSRSRTIIRPKSSLHLIKLPCLLVNKMEKNHGHHIL